MDAKTIQSRIFKKRGNPSWKEKKLLDPLIEHFEKELKTNPNALEGIDAAKSFDELQFMHGKYCMEDAVILEETPLDPAEAAPDPKASAPEPEAPAEDIMDPMNRQAPKVRDYVLEKTAMEPTQPAAGQQSNPAAGGNPVIPEPTSFEDAFRFPDGRMPGEEEKKNPSGQNGQPGQGGQQKSGGEKKDRPLNPAFDDMSGDRKRRQTRKFAKRCTQMICNMMERGYEWWVTKDITEVKLIEYELNDEMDLNLLVSLDGVQEQTVKAFFQKQCLLAKQEATISEEDREDLADALAEVMLEKGIAPTPMQQLMMTTVEIVGRQGMKAMVAASQISVLLAQLREMKQGTAPNEGYQETAPETPAPEPPRKPHPSETVSEFGTNKGELQEELRQLNA